MKPSKVLKRARRRERVDRLDPKTRVAVVKALHKKGVRTLNGIFQHPEVEPGSSDHPVDYIDSSPLRLAERARRKQKVRRQRVIAHESRRRNRVGAR